MLSQKTSSSDGGPKPKLHKRIMRPMLTEEESHLRCKRLPGSYTQSSSDHITFRRVDT